MRKVELMNEIKRLEKQSWESVFGLPQGLSRANEPTDPNRWTAEVKMEAGTNGTGFVVHMFDGGQYQKVIYCGTEQACHDFAKWFNRTVPAAPEVDLDELKARWPEGFCWCPDDEDERHGTGWHSINYHRSAIPADDLPKGVERISDGTTWLRVGCPLPEGWEWRYSKHAEGSRSGWTNSLYTPVLKMCEVRPIPEPPATEKVPWYEAVGWAAPDGAIILSAVSTVEGEAVTDENGKVLPIDSDGMVEVLVERES